MKRLVAMHPPIIFAVSICKDCGVGGTSKKITTFDTITFKKHKSYQI